MGLKLPQGSIDQEDCRGYSSPSTGASSSCSQLSIIGEGGTATVHKFQNVAVKVVDLQTNHEAFEKERKILTLLGTVPNVVNLAQGPNASPTEVDDEKNVGMIYLEL
eukprot:GHVN01102279.1.p1 GENE.GHVN01102279.1~~GHVN01102279.1.p1  ORF type:complete len:107 (+),score=1.78 GHVN01102279.1:54-374(+)